MASRISNSRSSYNIRPTFREETYYRNTARPTVLKVRSYNSRLENSYRMIASAKETSFKIKPNETLYEKDAYVNSQCRLLYHGVREISRKIWVIEIYECGKGIRVMASDTESNQVLTREFDEINWLFLKRKCSYNIDYLVHFIQIKESYIIIKCPQE
jgi:hypothetical protein